MRNFYFLVIVLILFMLSAPRANAITTTQTNRVMSEIALEYGITSENYPKIDGSTSTQRIVQTIYRAMHDKGHHYHEPASKTVPSYELLIDGKVDLIIVPYASSDIFMLAKQKGITLIFFPVAAEALIFITPAENTAKNITREQIRDIYLHYGITNWSTLGGPDRNLVPICRNADSGSQSQMDNLILKNEKMHPNIRENYVELTMEGMLELVAFYHNGGLYSKPTNSYALGYTLYTYLQNMSSVTGIGKWLKILSFEGVTPSIQNIKDGSYPLATAYYAVIRSDLPKDHSARNVISWLQSEHGIATINQAGFIPMSY